MASTTKSLFKTRKTREGCPYGHPSLVLYCIEIVRYLYSYLLSYSLVLFPGISVEAVQVELLDFADQGIAGVGSCALVIKGLDG